MGAVGVAALAANAASFGLLWAYRHGDANMRSAWLCTRNDVLGKARVLALLGMWRDSRLGSVMRFKTDVIADHSTRAALRSTLPRNLVLGYDRLQPRDIFQ